MGRILEIVERSIYKKIEAELILQGYAVDKALYPNDVLGITNYNNAVLAIVASKGFAIDLFGVGSSQKKYILSVPRIVIIKRKFMPGDLGGSPEPQYALNSDNNYEGRTQPPQTSDYHFQVNLCYKTAKHSRVLEEVIANSLNLRSYVKFYDDPSKEFFVTRYNSSQDTDEERGITEQIYLYEAKDIWESEDRVSTVSPSKIKEISLEISEVGKKDFDLLRILSPSSLDKPTYYGALLSNQINQSNIKTLNSEIWQKSDRLNLSFSPTLSRFVYAYPKSFGLLGSIIDPNNINILPEFTVIELSFTLADNVTLEDYYVYYNNDNTTQTNFLLDFKF